MSFEMKQGGQIYVVMIYVNSINWFYDKKGVHNQIGYALINIYFSLPYSVLPRLLLCATDRRQR